MALAGSCSVGAAVRGQVGKTSLTDLVCELAVIKDMMGEMAQFD